MSSYVVSNDTVRRAIHALASLGKPFNGKDLTNWDQCVELGNELFKLNRVATNSRYKERKRAPKYQHGPADPTTPLMQLYKSLHCLVYQCAEDKADRTWLFKQLEKAKAELAERIVEHSREYDACGWE